MLRQGAANTQGNDLGNFVEHVGNGVNSTVGSVFGLFPGVAGGIVEGFEKEDGFLNTVSNTVWGGIKGGFNGGIIGWHCMFFPKHGNPVDWAKNTYEAGKYGAKIGVIPSEQIPTIQVVQQVNVIERHEHHNDTSGISQTMASGLVKGVEALTQLLHVKETEIRSTNDRILLLNQQIEKLTQTEQSSSTTVRNLRAEKEKLEKEKDVILIQRNELKHQLRIARQDAAFDGLLFKTSQVIAQELKPRKKCFISYAWEGGKDGCDLHLATDLPQPTLLTDCYYYVVKQNSYSLHYFNIQRKLFENVPIKDVQSFDLVIKAMMGADTTKHLNALQLHDLITSNTDHIRKKDSPDNKRLQGRLRELKIILEKLQCEVFLDIQNMNEIPDVQMRQCIASADVVILICTPRLLERLKNVDSPVALEFHLTNEQLQLRQGQFKRIALHFSGEFIEAVPEGIRDLKCNALTLDFTHFCNDTDNATLESKHASYRAVASAARLFEQVFFAGDAVKTSQYQWIYKDYKLKRSSKPALPRDEDLESVISNDDAINNRTLYSL